MKRDGFLCGRRCSRGSNRGPLLVIMVAAALAAFSHRAAMATTYYWDPLGPGAVGGSGVWDASTADWSPNSTGGSDLAWPDANPNGDQAVFSGAAGTVSLNQTGDPIFVNSLSFQNSYTINGPATGRSTLNLSGTSPTINIGNNVVTLNAQLTGTHGFTEVGLGTLILGGDNSGLSGTVSISTNVLLDSALAGSANAAWNLNGGVIAYNPSVGGAGQTIQLGSLSGSSGMLTNEGTAGTSDVITYAIGSLGTNSTFGGVIADSGGGSGAGDRTALNKVGNATLALAGNNGNQTLTLLGLNTYSGPTTVSGGTLVVGGSIGKSSSIVLTQGGTVLNPLPSTLELNPSSATVDQIGDTTPITFAGSTFIYNGSTGAKSNETVGVLTLSSGMNSLIVNSSATGTATVSAAGLNRPAGGGTAQVAGTNLGLNTTATSNISRILLAAAPPLIGGGAITTTDTPSEHNAPIVPFLVGFGGGSASSPNTFITYSPAGGLRPLNPTDEFSVAPTAGQNTRIAGSTTVSSSVSINSLILDSGTLTIGTGTTLDVASGAVLINGNSVVAITAADASSTLSFNHGEAIITAFAVNPFANLVPIPISVNLANLTQLTIEGTSGTSGSNIILTQGSNTTDSAPVNLLSGTISVAQDDDLGYATGASAITFPVGSTAVLRMTGSQFTTSKGILLQGNAIFTPYQVAATFSGPISGPGGMQITGDTLTFSNPSNTYSGMTAVDSVALYLSANSNNNIPNSSMILAGSGGATANAVLNASGLTAPGGFQLHAGQTLAGFGTVVPPAEGLVVSSGSTISAGDGLTRTGNLKTSGLQIWNGGGEYLWKIDLTNAGTAGALNTDKSGAHWDQLTINSLSVAANSNNPFQIHIDGLTGSGTNTFDPTRNYSWVVANMPVGAATGNLVGAFSLSVSGLSNYKVPGSFSTAFDSTDDPGFTDLLLTYTATPEPTALTLLLPAAGYLLIRRRSVQRT